MAIALAATVALAIGNELLGVDLRISAHGRQDWHGLAIIAAGMVAVTAYCLRLGVPPRLLLSVASLGAMVVIIARDDLFVWASGLDQNGRTIIAAFFVGAIGRYLSNRFERPPAIWLVPAILPLLPAPATLVPLLAETEAARAALQEQALATAFLIGVGVASGDILTSGLHRYRSLARAIVPTGFNSHGGDI